MAVARQHLAKRFILTPIFRWTWIVRGEHLQLRRTSQRQKRSTRTIRTSFPKDRPRPPGALPPFITEISIPPGSLLPDPTIRYTPGGVWLPPNTPGATVTGIWIISEDS